MIPLRRRGARGTAVAQGKRMSAEDSERRTSSVPAAAPSSSRSTHREIEIYAAESLARFGAPGTLCVEGGELIWYAPQGVLREPLGDLDQSWSALPEEGRRRRAGELVRRLMSRRSQLPTLRPRRRSGGWVGAVVLLGAVALGAAYAARPDAPEPEVSRRAATPGGHRSGAVEGTADLPGERERAERAARVCAGARARVLRGGTIGPAETEGWIVDLLLLSGDTSASLHDHPALGSFVSPVETGRLASFVWQEEPELAKLSGPGTGVELTPELVEGPSGRRATGLRLTFRGQLVDPYFRPEERVRYFHVANALSDRLGATHAGLVARCDHSATHHVGSWFRGPSPADAATALVYLVGLYAEPPHLASAFLRAGTAGDPHAPGGPGPSSLDRAYAFAAIREATRPLDQAHLAALLGNSGGMITSSAAGSVITFPFTDANRASRASREIARAVHVGAD